MKVCFVITSSISVKTFYLGYLNFLKNHGLEVYVISNFSGNLLKVEELEMLSFVDIDFSRGPNPFKDLIALTKLTKNLKRIQPDILIYATPKASLLAAISGYILQIKVRVYQLWGLRAEGEFGLAKRLLIYFERLIFRLSTVVTTVSQSLAEETQILNLGKRPLVIAKGSSHGVDLTNFNPSNTNVLVPEIYKELWGQNQQLQFITLIGRLSHDKGVDVFLKMIAELRKEFPNSIGVLVGPIEDEKIAPQINQEISNGNVVWVNFTEDIRGYLRFATINCLPTLREGLPNIVLESSALGTPSVTTNATGAIDSVIDGVTGFIVKKSDSKDLLKATKQLLNDPSLLSKMSIEGINFVSQNFSSEFVWNSHLTFLQSLALNKRVAHDYQ